MARKICIIAFGSNIFIHAVIGASAANGFIEGTLSMLIMLALLFILSYSDLKHKVKQSRDERKKESKEGRK